MRFTQALVLLALSASVTPAAHAQLATARVDELITNFISSGQQRCATGKSDPALAKLKADGKIAEAYQAERSIHTVCVCMPAQAHALLKKLPAAQRETRVTQEEFAQKYLPRIMNTCAGEEIKASYGEGCAERLASHRRNAGEYCSCMSGRLGELTEQELSQLAKENAAYVPLATEARKKGLPLPKRTAALDEMKAFDEACAAP